MQIIDKKTVHFKDAIHDEAGKVESLCVRLLDNFGDNEAFKQLVRLVKQVLENRKNMVTYYGKEAHSSQLLIITERFYIKDLGDEIPAKGIGRVKYNRLASALQEAGFPEIHNMLDHCTLVNLFLPRSANRDEQDIQELSEVVADEYAREIINQLKPRTVICTSTIAYNAVVKNYHDLVNHVCNTCHPVCPGWYWSGGIGGRGKFISAAKDFLEETGVAKN